MHAFIATFNRRPWRTVCLLAMLALAAGQAAADLPTVAPPTEGETSNWLELILTYAKDAVFVLALIFGAAVFVWVAWIASWKFWDAIQGRGNWGELALVAVAGGGILVLVIFLLDQSRTVITNFF